MVTDTLDPNLLQSARKPKEIDDGNTPAERRRKRILKIVAYVVFFLVSIVFFTLVKIPDSAIANFILNKANAPPSEFLFRAEKVKIGFFPLPHVKMEKLGIDPRVAGMAPPIVVEEFSAYPNPFHGIGASFSALAYKSNFSGYASLGGFQVETQNLDLAGLTPLAAIGFELKGVLSTVFVQLAMQSQRLSTADGEIRLQGKNLVFDPSGLNLMIALPLLNIGDFDFQGTASKGQIRIDKFKLGNANKDFEVQIPSGTITLSDVTQNSRYDVNLLIKPSPAFEKAVPMVGAMLPTIGNKHPDGFYSLKVSGMFGAPAPSFSRGP